MKYYGYTSRHNGWATAEAVASAVARLGGPDRTRFDTAYRIYRGIESLMGHNVTHAWRSATANWQGLVSDCVHDRNVAADAVETAQAAYAAVEAELENWQRRIVILATAGIVGTRSLTNGWHYLCVAGGDINLRAARPELTSGQFGMNHGERTPLEVLGW